MTAVTSVLVVDDELDLLANLELALTLEGYRVLTAHNGAEALVKLQSEPVSLILADIAMSNMNGYQLYERVRENREWLTIPFIFLSARGLDSDIRYGKELGVDDYLTKPISVGDLLAVIRGKLRRAQQYNEALVQHTPASLTEERFLEIGRLKVALQQHRAWLDQQELKLSAKEFVFLEYMVKQAGRVIPVQELAQLTHELDTDHIEAGALLRPLILSLRRKLSLPIGEVGSIENVRGVGYRLVTPD